MKPSLRLLSLFAFAALAAPVAHASPTPLVPAFWTAVPASGLPLIFDAVGDIDQRDIRNRYAPLTPLSAQAELLPVWAQIQDAYAALYPAALPPPEVSAKLLVVQAEREINAWNTSIHRCARIPITITPRLDFAALRRPRGTIVGTRPAIAISEHGEIEVQGGEACPEAPIDEAAERKLVEAFNRAAPAGCEVGGVPGAREVSRATCPALVQTLSDELDSLVFPSVTDWIAVYSGAIQQAESRLGPTRAREAATFLLAHEYAHWARAHTAHARDYGFFYDVAAYERGEGIRPVADDAHLRSLWKIAVHPLTIAASHRAPDPARASEWNRYLAPIIRDELRANLLPRLCGATGGPGRSETDCSPACRGWITDDGWPRARACLASIPFGSTSVLVAGQIAARFSWRDFSPAAFAPKSLLDVLRAVSRRLDTQEFAAATFAEAIRKRGLGQYTFEEEADLVAYRILRHLGRGPQGAFDFYALFTESRVANVGERIARFEWDWDAANCLNVGAYPSLTGSALLPMGLLEDPHHSPCYRTFRLARGFWRAPVERNPLPIARF